MQLTIQCANNRKIFHLKYESFVRASYLKKLDPNVARVIFEARTRMFDIKVNYKRKYKFNLDCPFCKCKYYDETFDRIFKCNSGLFHARYLYATELVGFCSESSIPKVRKIGVFLEKYSKYREELLQSSCPWLLVHGLFLMVLTSVFLDLLIYYSNL